MLKAVSSISNSIGALNYKGTWNANTNTPTLASGVGTKGDYYVVSVAGATALDGISNWGIGDWAVFNGSAWQRVEGGADLNGVNLSVSGTSTLNGNVTFNDNLTQGTALKGINFTANTPAAGMASQLLNWYEEGTWTPSVSAATGWTSGTPGSVTATYTRVGRLVTLQLRFALGGSSGNVTAGDSVTITGVPFAESAITYGQINGANDIANNVFFTGAALISSSTLICTVATAAGSTPRTNAIFVKITYQV